MCPLVTVAETAPTIRIYSGGATPSIQRFQQRVVDRLFNLSREKYGDYTLQFIDDEFTSQRVLSELASGKYLHMDISTSLVSDEQAKAIDQQSFSFYQNLFGLRKLVVRQDDLAFFQDQLTHQSFVSLSAGLVRSWPDAYLMEEAGIHVVASAYYRHLFSMLENGRFDYIALGLMEVDSALSKHHHTEQSADLAIVDNVYLYYTMPVNMNVSKMHPEISQRIRYALPKVIESEFVTRVFKQEFQGVFDRIDDENALVFILDNPTINARQDRVGQRTVIKKLFPGTKDIYLVPSIKQSLVLLQ